MAGLFYVGGTPTGVSDITNRLAMNNRIAGAPVSSASVQAQLNNLVGGGNPTYATKTYVDTQDALYQAPSYYVARDGLNVPLTSINVPSGVAGLNSSSKMSLSQIPVVGAGYIKGPYGFTSVTSASTTTTPVRIADWNIGQANLQFRVMVFLSAFVKAVGGHPVIEIRIADSTLAPAYGSMTLVAQSAGRSLYDDFHALAVMPAPNTTSQTPSLLPTNYNVWLTAWLFDPTGATVQVSSGNIASGGAFLVRGAL